MVTELDNDVGRIAELLRQLKIEQNSLIIFSSDNGPHAEGGHVPPFFQSAGPYRGIKRDLYEGGVRPTIANWPGTIRADRVSDHVSAFWDWLPTLCEFADVDSPPNADGISIVPMLMEQGAQPNHEELYWEFHENGGKQAIRVGYWKAIRLAAGSDPDGPLELFNLRDDPSESTNVAALYPELVRDLTDRMAKARTSSEVFPFCNRHP